MLKILLKKQLIEIFRTCFYDAKKNHARKKSVTILFMLLFALLMLIVLGGMFAGMGFVLARPLYDAGCGWLYFALTGLLAVLLGTFGSVFNTYASLYSAKDNDLLLSLPIPVSIIMASRLLSVYLMGLMYSGVAFLPPMIVYWLLVPIHVKDILGGLFMFMLVSLIVFILCCLLGRVVAGISLRLKHRSFATVLASLLGFAAYYVVVFKLQTAISHLAANAMLIGASIQKSAYPIYLFGSVGTGDGVSMLLVTAVVLALLGLTWLSMSHSFLRLSTTTEHMTGKKTARHSIQRKSVHRALLEREFSRFTACPNYMLNCGLGTLMMVLIGIALLWKGQTLLQIANVYLGDYVAAMPLLLCAVVCFALTMNDMTAASVSLEGRTLWQILSLPLDPWQIICAKLELQLVLSCVPMVFCLMCIWMVCKLNMAQMLAATCLLGGYAVFTALLGMSMGLRFANLSWTNETMPMKQGAAVMICVLSGFAYVLALVLPFVLLNGWKAGFTLYAACFGVITLAADALLYAWLKRRGCKVFVALSA